MLPRSLRWKADDTPPPDLADLEREGDLRIRELVRYHLEDRTDPEGFMHALTLLLEELHRRAANEGASHAGSDDDDPEAGDLIFAADRPWLDKLRDDLAHSPKLRDAAGALLIAAILARALRFLARLIASANEAWKRRQTGRIYWRLGVPKTSHCPKCPQLAAGSPYTAETLPTVPGGDTPCQQFCYCHLEDEYGRPAFRRRRPDPATPSDAPRR